jgi:hypothetical protein
MKKDRIGNLKTQMIGSLAWAVGMVALALGAQFARKLGYIDQDTVRRLVTCSIGLWMAWYGNGLPKAMVRVHAPACTRQAQRVMGWSMALSGLVYAGLWAFAPIPTAMTVGTGAILTGIAVSLGYCLTLLARARAA